MWPTLLAPLMNDQQGDTKKAQGETAEEPSKDTVKNLGLWLAGGIGVLTGALTSFGIATGDIQRILRNTPDQALLWIAFIGFGVIAGVIVNRSGETKRRLKGLSLFMAFVGTMAIAIVAIGSLTFGDSLDVQDRLASQALREVALRVVFWTFVFAAAAWIATSALEAMKENREAAFHPWIASVLVGSAALLVPPVGRAWPGVVAVIAICLVLGSASWALDRFSTSTPESPPDGFGRALAFIDWFTLASRYRFARSSYRTFVAATGALAFVLISGVFAGILLSESNPPSWPAMIAATILGFALARLGWRFIRLQLLLVGRFNTPDGPLIVLLTLIWMFSSILMIATWVGAVIAIGIWLVVMAVLVAHVSSDGQDDADEPRRLGVSLSAGLLVVGLLAFVAGVAGFFQLGVSNARAQDRPNVTASLERKDGALYVSGSISASGLRASEHVVVAVEGLHSRLELSDVVAGPGSRLHDVELGTDDLNDLDFAQVLHLSRIGADAAGDASTRISIPLSVGLYERVRVSAFIAKPDGPDLISQLESVGNEIREERGRQSAVLDQFSQDFTTGDEMLARTVLFAVESSTPEGRDLLDAATSGDRVPPRRASGDLVRQIWSAVIPPDEQSTESRLPPQVTADQSAVPNAARIVEAIWSAVESQRKQAYATLMTVLEDDPLEVLLDENSQVGCGIRSVVVPAESASKGSITDVECEGGDDEAEDFVECKGSLIDHLTAVRATLENRLSEESPPEEIPERACLDVALQRLKQLSNELNSLAVDSQTPMLSPGIVEAVETFEQAIENEIVAYSNRLAFTQEPALAVLASEIRERARFVSLLQIQRDREQAVVSQRRAAAQCNEEGQIYGCVILLLPEVQSRPVIDVEFPDGEAVTVTVRAAEMARSDEVVVEVISIDDSRLLMTAVMGPDQDGTVERTYTVATSNTTEICVGATIKREAANLEPPTTTTVTLEPSRAGDCVADDPNRASVRIPLSG